MKKKPMQRLLAWMLVVILVLSTGINAWADESIRVPEESRSVSEMQIETQTGTQDGMRIETEPETLTESAGDNQTEDETTVLSGSVEETAELTEEESEEDILEKVSRAGSDRSDDFKIDKLKIINASTSSKEVVYHEVGGTVQVPASGQTVRFADNEVKLSFTLDWSQKITDPMKSDFKEDDYVEFEICSFSKEDSANVEATWSGYNSKKALMGTGADSGKILGYGEFEVKDDGTDMKLIYRVTFTGEVANKHDLGGTMESDVKLSHINLGEVIKIERNETSFFEFERKQGQESGYSGIGKPGIPGKIEKVLW